MGNRRPPTPPDTELIRSLATLLGETGLSEIEYENGGTRIRVARETARTVAVAAPAPNLAPVEPLPAANGADPHANAVTSPMVGVVYLAPQPGAAPFVRVGDTVTEGQTLLIIEAMKVMNQIRAPRAGRVTEILVADADAVEYGAALMLIE
ncbi:MAG TPA: acetyl-CoA carboxylase biotin carboxyl carrier protein [Stellaceae bacterium]